MTRLIPTARSSHVDIHPAVESDLNQKLRANNPGLRERSNSTRAASSRLMQSAPFCKAIKTNPRERHRVRPENLIQA